jgi:hypothetical protein
VRVENLQRASTLELVVSLVSRRERDLQKAGELALAPLAGAFCDVVGDRVNRSEKLRAETWCCPANGPPEGRAMACDREAMGLLPGLEASEGVHADMMLEVGQASGIRLSRSVTFPRRTASDLPSAVCSLPSAVPCRLPSRFWERRQLPELNHAETRNRWPA